MNDLQYGLRAVIRRVHESAAETKGQAPSIKKESQVCPICKGVGFFRRDLPPNHPQFGRAVVCRCTKSKLQAKRQKRLLKLSNLGMLSRFTFETFKPNDQQMEPLHQKNREEALMLCHQYAKKPQGWLLLKGAYGSGKTHLAAAIANYRIQQGQLTLFVVVPDLLDYLRATYGPRSEIGYDERFNQVRNIPLLILDNLDTRTSTAWAKEKLFQIINHRYNAQLPTVITTSTELDEIDLRIRARLQDSTISRIITLNSPSSAATDKSQATDLSILSLLAHMTFERFEQTPLAMSESEHEWLQHAYRTSYQFAENPSGWLVLMGDYGVGKTHLAAAIANLRDRSGHQALFIVVPDLLDHLRATYNPQSTVSYDERFEHIRRAPLLVLDDLGTQSSTRWAQEKLFQLFNYRYMTRLPTVITLNSLKQIDPRLRERMMEMTDIGNGSLLEIPIPPYRTRSASRNKTSDLESRNQLY